MPTDQLAYRKSVQIGQKIRKNDQNCYLIIKGYLNLHFSTFKQLKNAKKQSGTDQPTDQPTDRQTNTVTYRVANVVNNSLKTQICASLPLIA